jgi:hydrogenase 3 maturation protease
MLKNSWLEKLRETLNRLRLHDHSPKIGIIGIGHELRGDDAIGPYIVRRLASCIQEKESLLIVNAGPAPENCTNLLRRFAPDLVILIDAAEMGETSGLVNLIPWQDTVGISASTHSLPLHLFAQYLTQELNCEILFLGIQPEDSSLDAALNPAVKVSAEKTIEDLTNLLSHPPAVIVGE